MILVEDIILGMEYQTLTAIKGRPNYENINTIRRQIYANAYSVQLLRGGAGGRQGQIMTALTYLMITSTPYNNMPNPGALPRRPSAAFPAQWHTTKAAHKRALDEYNTSHNIDKSIKQQIIKAVKDPVFLEPINNHITGFLRVTACTMFQNLFNAYGNITPRQLDTNDTMMKDQWYPSTPIIYLFSKIQDGVYKANAGNAPYTVNQVLAIAFNHVFQTGIMQSACERWTSLPAMNNTWATFQDLFTAAHEKYESLTAQAIGYHGANDVQKQNTEKFYNETADAFVNLAMVAPADKELLITLTNTDSTLTSQLSAKDKLIATLQAQLSNSNTNAPEHRPVAAMDKNKHYCWTHGIRVSSNHSSENCHDPGEGHKKGATRDNRMGVKDA
jgi:hypothetical protein